MLPYRNAGKAKAVLLGIVVLTFFLGKICYDIHSDYKLTVSAAEQHARGLASALNEHALRTFNDTEGTIDSIIRNLTAVSATELPDESTLQRIFAVHQRAGSVMAHIFVASPDGRLHAVSSEYPVRPIRVTDRDYFQHHLKSQDPSLFISKPFCNRLDNDWLITATKRLSNPNGSLRLIVGVSVRTRYFSGFYKSLELSGQDRILLVRKDGAVLSSEPFSEQFLRTDFSTSPLFRRELPAVPSAGTFQLEHAQADGTSRIVSYRSATAYPIVSVISLDKQELLSQWRARAVKEGAMGGLLLALVAALAFLIRSQLASLRQANLHLSKNQGELREAKRRSQELVNSIDGIVWEIDLASSCFTFVSRRSEAITGIPSASWLGDPGFWSEHVHPGDRSWADWFAPGTDAVPEDQSFEYRFKTGDGGFIWLRDIVTVVREGEKPTRLRGVMLDISAAKQAEATLLEYQQAIESSSDMVSVIDRDYRLLVANRAFSEHLHLERAELIGRPLEQVLDEDRFAEMKPYLDACLSGQAVIFQQRVNSGAGAVLELLISLSPVEESGLVSRVACVARDTTTSKRAEQALRESEERYRRISNAITDYIYTVQVGDNLELCTWHGAGCLAVTGYTEAEFAADQFLWLKMVADEDRDAVQEHATQLIGGTECEAIEHRIYRKDGQVRWVRNTPVPRYDNQGRLREYEGLIQDITERRVAEEAMRHSEKRFRELLENVHMVSVILDATGKVTFCNEFLLELTGWSREETIGANWFDRFIPREMQPQISAVLEEALSRGTVPSHYENPILTKSGELRTIIWDNTVLHHPDGSMAGTASIGLDMTEHRALEEQLRQSQKMEATGLLAGGIAHDFNNILTVIIGYCSVMQMRIGTDDPNRANVDQILAAAERAAGLTRSLLAFSRKQVMNPQQVDLNFIVRHVEHFLCRVIGEDIALQAELYPEELFILADSGQIEQIMMNLATNARDAMPDGGVLGVRTEPVQLDQGVDGCAPGRYALLTVSDNGAGMSEETRVKIFEPFFTTKEVGKGTGLGLAMAYGIVKQHNGHVLVESEPGKGTRFKVYLPLITCEHPMTRLETKPPELRPGHELILVAEDEESVRNLVQGILTRFGYRVLVVRDGAEAVATFKEHRDEIDLLLLDMIMPKMSGKAAFDEISKLRPGAKVLFTSGYTADVISSKGELGPEAELVMKPVQPLVLLQKIREQLDGRR